MNNSANKKLGRRKAGSYGRPGSKKQKRAASKGVRKLPIYCRFCADERGVAIPAECPHSADGLGFVQGGG